MAKQYAWSTTTSFASDTNLSYGVEPNDQSWHTTDVMTGSATALYYYRDANISTGGQYTDANSSRVATTVTNSWTASIDASNVLTITLTTTIDSIVRDDFRGSNQDSPGRVITINDSVGSTVFGPYTDNNLTSYHQISGSISVGTTTIVLQPGQSAEKSALQLHNQTVGYQSYDDIGIGVRFKNPLPANWTATLNYNANGGSGAPSAQTATVGVASTSYNFTIPNTTPTWGQFIFLGWSNTQISGSGTAADVDYVAGDTFTIQQSDPTKTIYAVWMKDYRPGSVYNGSDDWLSHNRSTGCADIFDGTTWKTMRTIDGGVGTGNPPEIYDGTTWHNMRKIGTE